MKIKKLTIILILILTIVLINNFSYASTVTQSNLKSALKTNLSSGLSVMGTITVNDGQIVINNAQLNTTLYANYSISGDAVVYSLNIDQSVINNLKANVDRSRIDVFSYLSDRQEFIKKLYLSVADAVGTDRNLAEKYYNQEMQKGENIIDAGDAIKTKTEIFTLTEGGINFMTENKLEVNAAKLATLGSNPSIETSSVTTVTQTSVQTPAQSKVASTINSSSTGSANSSTTSASGTSTTSKSTTSADKSTSSTILPKTGKSEMIYAIVALIAISFITFKMYKKYEDVK